MCKVNVDVSSQNILGYTLRIMTYAEYMFN